MAAPPLSLPGIYGSLRMPTGRDFIYSAKAFVAAALALLIGFSQNFDNPYWSALTIYIVVNPPGAGAIRQKSLMRLLGTLVGGALVLALTGLFGDQINILVTATIGAVAGAVFLQHIDKTPTNYFWFAVAVTISVIVLNNVTRPADIFDITTARVGEISLGILAIMAIDSFWPEPLTPKFLTSMADWRGKARDWLVDALRPQPADMDEDAHRRAARDRLAELIKGIAPLDGQAVVLPFDIVPVAPRKRDLDLVRRQVIATIGDLVAIELRAGALRRSASWDGDLQFRLDAVSAWVRETPEPSGTAVDRHIARGEALAEEIDVAAEGIGASAGRDDPVKFGLLRRVATFVRDWRDLSLALRAVETGRDLPARLIPVAKAAKPIRSVDYLGAARDLVPLVVAMGAMVTIWYLTAWDSGPTALLFAWAGCIFLLGQGQILQSMSGMLACVLTAFALVFLYQFVVLPRVTDFVPLIIMLGCILVPVGVLMAMNMSGMLILALLFSFLALQSAYRADFAQTAQTLSGCVVGLLVAVFSLRLFDYDRAGFAVRRLDRAVRRDLVDMARASRLADADRFLFLALYRLSLYLTAAGQLAQQDRAPDLNLIPDLAIGANLLALRRLADGASPAGRQAVDGIRAAVAESFDRPPAEQPRAAVRARVDAALNDPAVRSGSASADWLDALTGLDLALAATVPPAADKPAP